MLAGIYPIRVGDMRIELFEHSQELREISLWENTLAFEYIPYIIIFLNGIRPAQDIHPLVTFDKECLVWHHCKDRDICTKEDNCWDNKFSQPKIGEMGPGVKSGMNISIKFPGCNFAGTRQVAWQFLSERILAWQSRHGDPIGRLFHHPLIWRLRSGGKVWRLNL